MENGVRPSDSKGVALCSPILWVTYRPPFGCALSLVFSSTSQEAVKSPPGLADVQGCPLWVSSLPLALARESLTVLPALTPTFTVPIHTRGACVSPRRPAHPKIDPLCGQARRLTLHLMNLSSFVLPFAWMPSVRTS